MPLSVIPRVGGESRKFFKPLDPPVKPGDDDIKTFVAFYKSLFMMPIYKEEFNYSAFITL
jgi:hypothetical protein